MGTTYTVKYATDIKNSDDIKNNKDKVEEILRDINMQMSTYIDDSEISKFNRINNTKWMDISEDFAFVVEERFSSGEIITLVKNIDKELIKVVKIFDIYQGDNIEIGKKSIAFTVTLEPKDKTLSENDIEQISKKIVSSVQESTGATIRS